MGIHRLWRKLYLLLHVEINIQVCVANLHSYRQDEMCLRLYTFGWLCTLILRLYRLVALW